MRNKFKLLYVALLAVVISACSDAYEITQDSGTDNLDELYSNVQALERGVTGLYYNIPAETEIGFTSIFTDETAVGASNGGQGITDGGLFFNLNSGSAEAETIWVLYYRLIRNTNELLEAADKLLESDASSQTAINNLKAEMLTLRAFANLKLFMYFTPDYNDASGMSIMKLDVVPPKDLSLELPRENVGVIVDFIKQDLQDAESLFSSTEVVARYRVNKFVIEALRTKLGACINDPVMVEDAFTELQAAGFSDIATAEEYKHIFGQLPGWLGNEDPIYTADPYQYNNPSELLFYLQRKSGGSQEVAANWYSVAVLNQYAPFFEVGRSLYNAFDALDAENTGTVISMRGDVRYNVNLIISEAMLPYSSTPVPNYQNLSLADYKTRDVLMMTKYKGKSDNNLQNDVPVLRLTDALLSLAEARTMEGKLMSSSSDPESLYANKTESVQSILFYLQVNRRTEPTLAEKAQKVTPMTITSVQQAYEAILDERRVEFAFEGHRYLDMKRLGAKAGSEGFVRDDMDVRLGASKSLDPASYKLTLPIPESEIRSNSLIVPNPGY